MEHDTPPASLIDNLLIDMHDLCIKNMSQDTKERAYKDALRAILRDLMDKLNAAYPDVTFSFRWQVGSIAEYLKDDQCFVRGFDKHMCDDESTWCDFDIDENKDRLYQETLASIGILLFYNWNQKCNLGHTHRTTRFYAYSTPKVTEIANYYRLCPDDMKDFVQRYVPNFFY